MIVRRPDGSRFAGLARLLGSRRTAALPVAAAAFAGLVLLTAAPPTAADRALHAWRDGMRAHDASGGIVLVEIDALSLKAIDRWPWPRGVHARAVDALRGAGARTIAFDVDFSARSTPQEDAKLAAALARAGGTVILPTFSQSASGTDGRSLDNLPIPEFRDHAFLGAVTIVPDDDGLVRTAPTGIRTAGAPRPSIAALLADTNASINSDFPIDFAIRPQSIPRIGFADLIAGRVAPSRIAGKRVLIGATAIEMGDRYATPGHGVIPGAVIQALAAETLDEGRVPASHGGWPGALVALAGIAVAALVLRGAARPLAVAATLALLLFGPVATQIWWEQDFAAATGLAMVAVACGLWVARRVLAAFADRMLRQGDSGLPNLAALALSNGEARPCVAVARLGDGAALGANLGPQAMADLARRVADRLALGANGAVIHHIDAEAFAWIVPVDDRAVIDERFDALAAILRAPVEVEGRRVDAAATFGIADGDDARRAASNALLAATQAHAAGARWRRHAEDGDEAWRLSLLGELDAAVAAGDLHLAYQPKYDFATGRVASAEALVRWNHPLRGPIPPDDFIIEAERGGRIEALTAFVLGRALRDVAASGQIFAVAVNISAGLLISGEIVSTVRTALAESGVRPGLLTLEVTESAAMQNTDMAVAVLAELKLLGVRISIDDYGTGQSTLSYLKRLPADELKIDKSFVQSMGDSRSDDILVASTINLAKELGLAIVAEGVETDDALARLGAMGCDYAQGYLIGRPMPIADLLAMAATKTALAA